jgi:hypothetical protein
MPCPVCDLPIGENDHRWCVLDLLKSGQIRTSREWEKMARDKPAKPVTICKGRVKAVLPKD